MINYLRIGLKKINLARIRARYGVLTRIYNLEPNEAWLIARALERWWRGHE